MEKTLKASDLMTKKVIKIHGFSSLEKAVKLMKDNKISSLAIISGRKNLIGMITKTTISNFLKKEWEKIDENDLKKLKNLRVIQLLQKAEKVSPETSLEDIKKLMEEKNVDRIFVMKGKNLVGIISKSDFARLKLKTKDQEIFTKVDEMLNLIEQREKITFEELAKELKMEESVIEEWARIFEDHGFIEIEYPLVGKPFIRKRK
jgi:predicted transcriptional regulator